MKYAGNITIFDESGNTVYEHDLTADEMIEILLTQEVASTKSEAAPVPAPTEHISAGPIGQRKTRICSLCGKIGHDVRKCEKNEPRTFGLDTGIVSQTIRAVRRCGNCGSTGHQRQTCVSSNPASSPAERGMALEKTQWETVKKRFSEGVPGGDIADEVMSSVSEVRVAAAASSFLDYIRRRREAAKLAETVN